MQSLLCPIEVADQPIIDQARAIYESDLGGIVSEATIRKLNARLGTDVATAVLYLHFESKLLALREEPLLRSKSIETGRQGQPLLVAVVPGAFYEEHPETGADGRELIALSSGEPWECERIQTKSLGTSSQNAEIINKFLYRKTPHYRVILVSLSRGTLDAAIAYRTHPELFSNLTGWVSVSGVPRGTRMADWLLDRWRLRPICNLMLWYHGADKQAVEDLRHRTTELLDLFRHQTDFPMIHLAAFPLDRHLSCWRARLWHRRFRSCGPNDSVVMLEDLLELSGIVIPVWGADHYLKSTWDAPRAVFRLIALLGGDVPAYPAKPGRY